MKNRNLLLAVLLLTVSLNSQAVPAPFEFCTTDDFLICPIAVFPVCGVYADGSTEDFTHRCYACQAGVVKFTKGKCSAIIPPFPIVKQCPSTECSTKISPVCAYYDQKKVLCFKFPCAIQMNNACLACKAKNIIGYVPGPCPKGIIYDVKEITPVLPAPAVSEKLVENAAYKCNKSLTSLTQDILCTKEYKPVCGIDNDCNGIKGEVCYKTFDNSCFACKEPSIDAYMTYGLNGCGKPPVSYPYPANMIKCLKKVCPLIWKPVCLLTKGCAKTYSNSCFACQNDNVGFIDGPCPKKTNPVIDDLPIGVADYTCTKKDLFNDIKCGSSTNFVCAELLHDCLYGKCTTYAPNKCHACHNHLVSKVSAGLCRRHVKYFSDANSYVCQPEDRLVTDFSNAEFHYCAVTSTGLREYGSESEACSNEDVIKVFDKECPKDE